MRESKGELEKARKSEKGGGRERESACVYERDVD